MTVMEITLWVLLFYGALLLFFARALYVYRRRDDEVLRRAHPQQGLGDEAR